MNTKSLLSLAIVAALTGCSPFSNSNDNTGEGISISGDANVGQTLTATITDTEGVNAASAVYTWFADGVVIAGATSSSYTLTAADVGKEITVSAGYTDNDGESESFTSAAGAISPVSGNPGSVSISGDALSGATLTATIADPDGFTASSPTYEWNADGVAIAGATSATYTLTSAEVGKAISVDVSYTDDSGTAESVASIATGAVQSAGANVGGAVAITGDTATVGTVLQATITDTNGTTGSSATYQWLKDGVAIVGETGASYTVAAGGTGGQLSVSAAYTDDGGNAEAPVSASIPSFDFIIDGEASLQAAAAAATDGQWIGLDSASSDDYADMAQVEFAADNLYITRTAGSTANISGTTCVIFSGSGTTVDGLEFSGLTWDAATDCLGPDASILIEGQNNVFVNNQILSEGVHDSASIGSSDPFHYLYVAGTNHLIERNSFIGKNTDLEGSAISMNVDDDSSVPSQGSIVQYNLFKDFVSTAGSGDSGGHALQLGRSTGAGSADDVGNLTVQYNLFDNAFADRRIMRVQSSENLIKGNTLLASGGNLSLEDGYGNTVSHNIIISDGGDGANGHSDDGGIAFNMLGHTIEHNYINNIRTTSSDRAALLFDTQFLDNSGNAAIIASMAAADLTSTVSNNTIVNARQAMLFDKDRCDDVTVSVVIENNLVANQTSSASINGNTNGSGRKVINKEGDYLGAGCGLGGASVVASNHFYSQDLSDDSSSASASLSGLFNADASNIYGGQDGATLTAVNTNNMVEGSGTDGGVGVDIEGLQFIDSSMVGPNTTWTGS